MNILRKEMIYMIFFKKGGSREKGGGGNEIHAPCDCGLGLLFIPNYFCING